ncbi:MAG: GHKL domain-containing protein [Geobacteraceae bacterium]|nr:GHKL domain-containing protein [Geobacteraceae bacterium]
MSDSTTSLQAPENKNIYIRRLVLAVVLLNLLVYVLAAVWLRHSWNHLQTGVSTSTQNIALVLENSIDGMIGKIDVAVTGVLAEAEENHARGKIDRKELDHHISRQCLAVPELDSIRMTDSEGRVLYGKDTATSPPVTISDREYFQFLRDNPRAGMYISRPFFGRISKAWVFAVARRVNHPDGSFAGVVYGVVPIELFTRLFSSLDVGRDGAISLRDTNLAVIARFPEPDGVGSSVGQRSTMKEFVDLTRAGKLAGTFSGPSSFDRISRIFSYRKITNLPFYVVVGQSINEMRIVWRTEAIALISMILLFSAVTVMFSLKLVRAWQQEKRIDSELRNLNQQLEARVMDRTAELSTINQLLQIELAGHKRTEAELDRRTAEIEHFIYTVSHDLRSPLVTVKTFLGYLGQDITSGDRERADKDMEFIHSAANRMEALLNELLEVSRIGRENQPHEAVGLRDLVAEALDAVAGQITAGRVDVRVNGCDMTLRGDRRRLLQIWQNLLDNAVKYMGNQPSALIEIGCEDLQGERVYFVRDNGIGIAPEYQDRIFGIFEQLDRQSSGFGMGLTMVRRIVETYDGRIWVESAGKGQGSCFRFTLPGAEQSHIHRCQE